jgi:hypothetical protein
MIAQAETHILAPAERRSVLDARGEEETADEDVTWNVNVYEEGSCKLETSAFPFCQIQGSFMLTVACYTKESSTLSINTHRQSQKSVH